MDIVGIYSPPSLTVVGTLRTVTAGDRDGDGSGRAYGKGSICADGNSGLIGNRSDKSGSCN